MTAHSKHALSLPDEPSFRQLWDRRLDQFGFRLEGSPVWPLVETVFAELEQAGLTAFRPRLYVSNEWGCPDGEPLIGIPFYLVDPQFHAVELWHCDDLEDDPRILKGIRHEAGHAFLYAYKLYDDPEWAELFGDFYELYDDDYVPTPFLKGFVRHLPGWYSQKHADEDFAETFAVWLTPGLDWRRRYAGTPALAKLEYLERVAPVVGKQAPVVDPREMRPDPDELAMTVREYYAQRAEEDLPPIEELGTSLDDDLRRMFPAEGIGTDAASLVSDHRRTLMHAVSDHVGSRLYVVKKLIDHLVERLRDLSLRAEPGKEIPSIIWMTSLVSTLTSNFLHTGHFAWSDDPAHGDEDEEEAA